MAAPLKPHWQQPSHPDIQQVVWGEGDFSSKSLSKVAVAPFGVFADMSFPPCTLVEESAYSTVQISRDRHIDLNSDLLYLNHSCEPSLILDTSSMQILAGPKGLTPGDELTFFYPSTEWHMAQPFPCACRTPSCRGLITGARDMTREQLAGYWLSGHIRELKGEQQQQQNHQPQNQQDQGLDQQQKQQQQQQQNGLTNGDNNNSTAEATRRARERGLDRRDPTVQALQDALAHADKVVIAAKSALVSYLDVSPPRGH